MMAASGPLLYNALIIISSEALIGRNEYDEIVSVQNDAIERHFPGFAVYG